MPEKADSPQHHDFFISYTHSDLAWAEWIRRQLEAEGWTTRMQASDFGTGDNFVANIDKALRGCDRVVAVLSPAYLSSRWCTEEWTAALKDKKLFPVRVVEVDLGGLLGTKAYIDLWELEEPAARSALVDGLEPGRRPAVEAAFPGKGDRRFPGSLPPIFNLTARNRHFTGRGELLETLRNSLETESGTAAVTAMSGLGGIGKSELAREYGWRYHTSYSHVWWVRAEEPATLIEGFVALAVELGLADADSADQEAAAGTALNWLRQNTGWLLVLDNAPNAAAVRDFLPASPAGHTIVTSRDPNWRAVAVPLEVKKLPVEDSVAFLARRTGRDEPEAARALAKLLDNLPLALEQAAAYVEASQISLADYAERFQDYAATLLDLNLTPSYPRSVAATLGLSLDRVEEECQPGAELLSLLAFCAPDEIPRDMVEPHFESPLEFDKAVAGLTRYSLAQTGDGWLSIHRLVQELSRIRLARKKEEARWAEAAAELTNNAFQYNEHDLDTWPASARQLPHALATADHAERLGVAAKAAARLFNDAGLYLLDRGRLNEAEAALRRALAIDEKIYGPDHPEVATDANNIGTILKAQGDLEGALEYTRRALAIDEKVYGPDHPNVATDANNMGQILQDKGDLEGALEYTGRALAIDEKVYGPDHPNVATLTNNIGQILKAQGDLEGALEYTRRALAIDEKVYGPDHPNVATLANNTGQILKDQGDLEGALEYARRAVRIGEATWGADNPNTRIFRRNLEWIEKQLGSG